MSKLLREIVSENIRHFRIESGLTQIELARRAKLTDVYISRIEQNAKNLTLDSVEQIANALQIPISSLIKDTKIKLPKSTAKTASAIKHTIGVLEAYLQAINSDDKN